MFHQMNIIKVNKNKVILELSKDELGVLSNALNEVCNGIEVWEFDTRIGIKIEEARTISESLASIYKKANQEKFQDE